MKTNNTKRRLNNERKEKDYCSFNFSNYNLDLYLDSDDLE